MRATIHNLCVYGTVTQLIVLIIISIVPARATLTHDERMEFILRNGLIGLVAASLATATREP